MAQYVQPGFYSFSMPKGPPAKAEMVAPRAPSEYNAHYLHGTRRADITTPVPRAGKILPGARFDVIGPAAAKVSMPKPKDPDLYNRGPFDKAGRMSFESTIPAPIATSTEYKFLPFKAEAEVNFGDKDDVPPVSIFSNMAPLDLVDRLIKGVTDPERKEAFEAMRKFLLHIELVKATRPLTYAEESEYGQVVNGLRAKALDAFGDGSTQFASQLAYDLGIQLGVSRAVPPAPVMFVPPAAPAPVPGPGIAPAAVPVPAIPPATPATPPVAPAAPAPVPAVPVPAAPALAVHTPSVPPAAPVAAAIHQVAAPVALPSDATIDTMDVDAVFYTIAPIVQPADQKDFGELATAWNEIMAEAKEEVKSNGGISAATQRKLATTEQNIKDTAKGVIQEYMAMQQLPTPPATPTSAAAAQSLAPTTPAAAPTAPVSTPRLIAATPPASTHPLLTPLIPPSASPFTVAAATTPMAKPIVKKTGVEHKMPPEVRVMMAQDFLKQPSITATQQRNAEKVIDAHGAVSDQTTKSAFDSMHGAMKQIHNARGWQGTWYSKKEYQAAKDAGVGHPSLIPAKAASAGPATSPTAAPSMTGSGRPSFMDHPDLHRGLAGDTATDSGLNLGWKPTAW